MLNVSSCLFAGRSMGARTAVAVCNQMCAVQKDAVQGVLCLSFPLNLPGKPQTYIVRSKGLLELSGTPVLFVSGTADNMCEQVNTNELFSICVFFCSELHYLAVFLQHLFWCNERWCHKCIHVIIIKTLLLHRKSYKTLWTLWKALPPFNGSMMQTMDSQYVAEQKNLCWRKSIHWLLNGYYNTHEVCL